jgi:hypothetical protein
MEFRVDGSSYHGCSGLFKEQIADESSLRKILADACDNRLFSTRRLKIVVMNGTFRCTHVLPVGGSIDTSSAIFEIEITQLEGDRGVSKQCVSKCILVDVPAVDPLIVGGSDLRRLESVTLHKVPFLCE